MPADLVKLTHVLPWWFWLALGFFFGSLYATAMHRWVGPWWWNR